MSQTRPPSVRVAALGLGLIAASLLVPGCEINGGTTAGLSSYQYGAGILTTEVSDTLDRTYAAAVSAAEETGVMIRDRSRSEGSAEVHGVMAGGHDVRIKLTSIAPSQTRVRIHVGFWGSEGQSRVILDRMRYNLAVAP
jgi:hypothetical protein